VSEGVGFVDRLVGLGLVDASVGLPDASQVMVVDGLDERVVIGGPVWCSRSSGRLFDFETFLIAEHQMDDNLLDVIEPVVAVRGLELVHDWNVEPQHEDTMSDGLRIWINGEPVTFPSPEWVECMRPLELVNWLMRQAGIGEQFYFAGRQWTSGYKTSGLSGLQFYSGEVVMALLTDEMFQFLSTTDGITDDAARPIPMSDVVGSVESWETR